MAFPVACERAANATGVEVLRMDHRQSWVAVGLMGVLVAAACRAGRGLGGRSRLYRAVVAGLEAHGAPRSSSRRRSSVTSSRDSCQRHGVADKRRR